MRIPRLASIILCLWWSTGILAAESTPEFAPFKVVRRLQYSEADAICQLDLFLPKAPVRATPCIVVIQGGGFRAQDGQKFHPFAEYLAQHGFAAALIGYRGQPDHTRAQTIADTQTAVRYVRKISKQHGINPDKIGAMGRSAGATIAALLAASEDAASPDPTAEHAEYSSAIQAWVGISGVYDFIARFEDDAQRALQPNLAAKLISNGAWINAPYAVEDPHWLQASARRQLHDSFPPMLLLHARNDSTVPWLQSQQMHESAISAGVKSSFFLSETGGHAGPTDAKTRLTEFFHKTLGSQRP